MINKQAQFSKFSLQLDAVYLTLVLRLECLDFSCALTTSGKGRRRDIKFKCSHAGESACMHLEAMRTRRRRTINPVDRVNSGETH